MKHARSPGVLLVAARMSLVAFATVCASCTSSNRDGDGAPPTLGVDGGVTPVCSGTRCSRDLKQILDGCDGHVIQTCASGEGCGAGGTCISACAAAADSQGSLGCDFLALPPDTTTNNNAGSCFAAFIGNTWDEPISIHVDYDNQEQDASMSVYLPVPNGDRITYPLLDGPLAPGKAAIVFLSQAPKVNSGVLGDFFTACPGDVQPILRADPIRHRTARTKSFRIRTDAPVSAYTIFPYGGAISYVPSAMLLLPTSSLRSDYVLLDAWAYLPQFNEGPRAQIVANEDGTTLQLTPSVDLADGNDVVGTAAGKTASYTLNRGEVLQFASALEFNGSTLTSNKPVAVFGGTSCMNIPDGNSACDAASQQLLSTNQWGSEYVGVRYRSRLGAAAEDAETVPWRIIAAVDGTVLTYDPEPPPQAPATLSRYESSTFWTPHPFSVHSQDDDHPIFMSAYMTGGQANVDMGDPEFVNVVPTDQYLDHYVFYADVTYSETSLTFVRRKVDGVFKDVTLDCAGVISNWGPIGNAGDFEFTRVDLSVGLAPVAVSGGECFIGAHEAHSDGAFTATVWGWDTYASYAYPVGMGIRPLNQLTLTPR